MEDDNYYYVWYTTHFSTHEISIVFTSENSIAPNIGHAQPDDLQIIYGAAVGAAIVAAIVVTLTLLTRTRKQKTI
jgi:hypothetical protein